MIQSLMMKSAAGKNGVAGAEGMGTKGTFHHVVKQEKILITIPRDICELHDRFMKKFAVANNLENFINDGGDNEGGGAN